MTKEQQSAKLEKSWCSDCGRETTWVLGRKRWTCQSCRAVFPCPVCRHMDCMEVRGEAVLDDNNVLRPKKPKPKQQPKTR